MPKYQIIYHTSHGHYLKEYRIGDFIIMYRENFDHYEGHTSIHLILAMNDPRNTNYNTSYNTDYCYVLGISSNISIRATVLSDNMINVIKKRLFVK